MTSPARLLPYVIALNALVLGSFVGCLVGERLPQLDKPSPSRLAIDLIAEHYDYGHDPRAPHGMPAEILHLGGAAQWDLHGKLEALLTVHRPLGKPGGEGDDLLVDVFVFGENGVERTFHRAVPALGHQWTIEFAAWPDPHLWIAAQCGHGSWLDLDIYAWDFEGQEWDHVYSVADVPDATVSRQANGLRFTSGWVTYDLLKSGGRWRAIPSVSRPLPFGEPHRATHVLDTGESEWNGRPVAFGECVGLDGSTVLISEILPIGIGDMIHVRADPLWPGEDGDVLPEFRDSRPTRLLLHGGHAEFLPTVPPRILAHSPGSFALTHRPDDAASNKTRIYRFDSKFSRNEAPVQQHRRAVFHAKTTSCLRGRSLIAPSSIEAAR